MILCSAIHHPEAKERDNLLHMLFNLIKRPDEDQRWGVKNLLLLISLSLSLSLSLVSNNAYATKFTFNTLQLQYLTIQYIALHSCRKKQNTIKCKSHFEV